MCRGSTRLVNDSKHEQSKDLKIAKAKNPHLSDDEISAMAPDNNYYFMQCRRMEAPIHRDNRKATLIDETMSMIKSGQFLSIVAPVAMASK